MSVLLLFALLLPMPARAQDLGGAMLAAPNSDDEVVYIDPGGYIRVYDPVGSPQITWVSLEGGWSAAALGDFTGEGDEEIVAVGGEGAGSRLTIYDPVVATGSVDAGQQFNGVPWKTLYTTPLPATPRLVAVGEFDAAVPGREIVYITDAPSDGDNPRSQITVLVQTANPADGTAWAQYATLTSGQQWSDIATGDLEFNGVDNIAVIDEDRGALSVFRLLDGALQQYFVNASESRPWSGLAIGHVDPATQKPELVLVRRADRPLASLVVWRYEAPNTFVDVYLRDFNPAPRVVFLADVNGTGDSEIFMLRNVTRTTGCPPPYNSAPFQLIMRNRGEDRPPAFEVCLDQTNTFRYGVGGDLYGDGHDEVIVLSATQLRIFSNLHATFTVTNETVSSDARTVLAGNLDKAGAVKPNTLAANPERLNFTVSAGGESAPQTIELTNSASAEPILLRVHTSPQVNFVRWSLSSSATPATLTVYVDAAELLPGLAYATDIVISTAAGRASNTPFHIPVFVEVQAGLVLKPSDQVILVTPCAAQIDPFQIDVRVFGSSGMTFSAEVAAGPASLAAVPAGVAPGEAADTVMWPVRDVPWITSAASPTTTVPSTITLTVSLSALAPLNQAHITANGSLGGVSYVRSANITVVCTDHPVYLPLVINESW